MQLRLPLHNTGQQHIHTGRHVHARHSEPPWRLGDMDCMLLDSVFLPPLARFIHNHRTVDCDVCAHVLAVRSAWMEEKLCACPACSSHAQHHRLWILDLLRQDSRFRFLPYPARVSGCHYSLCAASFFDLGEDEKCKEHSLGCLLGAYWHYGKHICWPMESEQPHMFHQNHIVRL